MMIGDMIAKARKEKGMSKTELARLTDINIGHLTHIEKGERNPSHKALKNICKALDIPYQQLMYNPPISRNSHSRLCTPLCVRVKRSAMSPWSTAY